MPLVNQSFRQNARTAARPAGTARPARQRRPQFPRGGRVEGQSPGEGGKSETRHLGPSISVRERGRAGRGQQQQQQLGVPAGWAWAGCSMLLPRQPAAGSGRAPLSELTCVRSMSRSTPYMSGSRDYCGGRDQQLGTAWHWMAWQGRTWDGRAAGRHWHGRRRHGIVMRMESDLMRERETGGGTVGARRDPGNRSRPWLLKMRRPQGPLDR